MKVEDALPFAPPQPASAEPRVFDTPDFRLAGAGYDLRYRWHAGWTLALPFDCEELGSQTNELAFPGEPDAPPPAALSLLRAYIRKQPVVRIEGPPPDATSAADVIPEMGAAALVGQAVRKRVDEFLRFDVLIRFRGEAEDVHRARSAIRKLRAVLRGFRWFLDRRRVEALRSDLRWLAGELGAIRDADVALAGLRDRAQRLPETDAPYVGQALEPLLRTRETARRRLDHALDGDRYFALLDRTEAFAALPTTRGECAALTAGELAERTLRKNAKKLRKAVRKAQTDSEPRALHRVRIRVRNGRYAAEACAGVAGKRAERLAKRLHRLQDALGAINDASFIQDRLRDATATQPRASLVAGELLAYEAAEGEKARCVWKRLRRKALRKDWIATSRA
ncbi:MAG: CHAD domain-containing protein [Candidatus Eremiobacteraeota bacterium]|nr:CHAD domain-containing protein [Candidatus Eremiobacteraeota bacterium]MBV8355544.1 CHAD domain-containing protein [Candidatus Eremiobacteraeota bacterium]